jgi:HNH endonuclease
MDAAQEQLVRERAGDRCEYCGLPESACWFPFEIDHIIAIKHGGQTVSENLALSCYYCNNAKGPCIASIDPDTGKIVRFFHPRRDRWKRHFQWDGAVLIGRTSIGRTTIALLEINHPEAVALREGLIEEGLYPLD